MSSNSILVTITFPQSAQADDIREVRKGLIERFPSVHHVIARSHRDRSRKDLRVIAYVQLPGGVLLSTEADAYAKCATRLYHNARLERSIRSELRAAAVSVADGISDVVAAFL